MQQGKIRTLDSGSAKGMQSFQSSNRRTGDVQILNKTPHLGQGNRQRFLSNNSSDLESSQLRTGTSCEDDRPNNWQDCYTWPASLMHKISQQSGNSDGYNKWARHADQRSPRDKSKTNNIADPSAVPSPRAQQNRTFAFAKHQHIPAKQAETTKRESSLTAGRGGPSGQRYSRPESGSQASEERTQLSQIWTALSDLLPQTQVPLDKMDSSEIVRQVVKIRNSLKSASSLLTALGKQPDSETTRLQRDYLDAIFELLHKQESCYLVALQRTLVTSEDDRSQRDTAELVSPKSGSKSEEPTELEISESSSDELENPTGGAAGDAEFPLNNQRPIIEDHLGDYSDSDLDELQQKLNSLNDAPWQSGLALPRAPSCTSSHHSTQSPLVKGRSAAGQKFHSDCLPAGAGSPSQAHRASRNMFQRESNVEGSGGQGPSTASTLAAAAYPVARVEVKGECDDKLVDSAAEIYGVMHSDADIDVLEDLSQLMRKKQELESFLAERNHQLCDLQQHHDLLKELLQQQEENAALLQGIDEERSSVWNVDRVNSSPPRIEENPSGTPSPRTKHTLTAVTGSKLSHTPGPTSQKSVFHQKNLLKESSRVKPDSRDFTKFKDDMRTCENVDRKMPVMSLRLGAPKDQPAKPSADWSAMLALSDSVQLFADCDHKRRKNGDEEETTALNPNQIEKKYCQKSRVEFELEDETALDGEDDDPNSSLALRDEPQHTKDGNDDVRLSEICNTLVASYEETGASSSYENSLQPLHNPPEKSVLMLQQNMSKLLEARKELEGLRNLLHIGIQQRPREIRSSHESGQRNDQSEDQQLRQPRTEGASAAYDQPGTHSEMMRLKLLKVANEKLNRLKLVMDDVQRSPGVVSMASLPFDRTASADGASATKASNTPTVSNFTLRNMQVSDLSSADRSQSQQTVDALDDQLNTSGLDRLLRLLSSEKPQCRNSASPMPPAKAPCQSAMKEGFFIRNSLPESVSSRGTSQPPSDNRVGGMDTNSRCPKGDGKGTSKNSSTTNVSNASCIPCISLSADCIPLETGYQNTVSTLPDRNSKKPCKVIRNQHVEFQHTPVSKPSTTFPRNSFQGVNVGKKNVAVNTEKMKHRNSEDDVSETRTELKNISQELKILRQEVTLLTQTISQNMASDRPAIETRGDSLDPKLLVGLNQSFQQLMGENRRLSDRFTQLRDFVLRQTTRNQRSFETCSENIFNRNEEVDSCEQGCSLNRASSFRLSCDDLDTRPQKQDETWAKSTHRVGAEEVKFSGNKSLKRHPDHLFTYLENDLNAQHCQSRSREVFYEQGICGDSCSTNSNGNNSRDNVVKKKPTAALLQEDNVSCLSTCALHPDSNERGVSSTASGSPARSQSYENPANYVDHRFSALKETIYSEVAVFISKHENRPYYLLELIRELQKLKTDSLRQQAVGTFDRIISKYLANDEFQMQVSHETRVKEETGEEAQLHSDSSLLYNSAIPGFSCFQGANSSSISGDVAEDEESQVSMVEEDVDRGSISCCTDPDNLEGKEDKMRGDGDTEEGDEEPNEDNSSSHSSGSNDSCSTDPDRLDDGCLKGGLEIAEREALDDGGQSSPSSVDDVHYLPDFKSETSSSSTEAEVDAAEVAGGAAAEAVKPTDNAVPTLNLDAVAEQMGFVTVEFTHAPSGGRINSENEKGSSASDGSWEKAEIPEKDNEVRPGESDTSEDIIEEIVEDCGSSGSVEELTLDQLREKLTSISKEEIARRMALECHGELSAQQILETVVTEPQNELAGDPVAIKQPASLFDKDESRHV